MYGVYDEGDYGITEFFKLHRCNNICKSWPKPTPLTPPPSFDDACAIQLMNCITPPPVFEDIVFPAYQETVPKEEHPHFSRKSRSYKSARDMGYAGRQLNSGALQVTRPERASSSERPSSGGRQRSHSNSDMSLASFLLNRRYSRGEPAQSIMTPPPSYDMCIAPSFESSASMAACASERAAEATPSSLPSPTPATSFYLDNASNAGFGDGNDDNESETFAYNHRQRHVSDDNAFIEQQIAAGYALSNSRHTPLRQVKSSGDNTHHPAMRLSATDPASLNSAQRRAASPLMRRRITSERTSTPDDRFDRWLNDLPTLIVPSAPPLEVDEMLEDAT